MSLRILITGASGFIGKPLISFLFSQGHSVISLPYPAPVDWDYDGFDGAIHLAGEPLTLSRWGAAKQQKILFSRADGTLALCRALSATLHPPKFFISASAYGYYGNRGDEVLTEESRAGKGFLPNVCQEWEKASWPLVKIGARVVHTRFGMVLGPNGGVLKKMILPYKLGLGGRLGTGKQWMSWIALDDLIQVFDLILKDESLEGPINVVSPHPVRQEEFSETLAAILHRPHFICFPEWLLRLRFGLMADEMLLCSTRVKPAKLLASNFTFHYPDLRAAMLAAIT